MAQAMLRWRVELNCGHWKEVWTTGDDPPLERRDNWFCRSCTTTQDVVGVIESGWVIAPDLKNPDQP
jgi:hypothetical protein